MSATGELRRMLDERGVEYFDGTETTLWGYEPTGESTGAYRFAADETSGGRMQVLMFNITPEQAIAATLGDDGVERSNDGVSRYSELFGTPERAAMTLETVADSLFSSAWSDDNATLSDVMCALVGKCDECVAQGLPGRGVSTKCGEVDYDALLEWLRGDA